MTDLQSAVDDVLAGVTTGDQRVPGVVAIATDRLTNIYEGAAGVRSLATGTPMTTDTVCAIFSTTLKGAHMDKKPFVPFVSASETMPEMTFKAIFLGALMAVALGAANAYVA